LTDRRDHALMVSALALYHVNCLKLNLGTLYFYTST